MSNHDYEHDHEHEGKHSVTISVNERPVKVEEPKVTGAQIKQAAISQGVQIQMDFILSEELGNRRTVIIGDNDLVTVNEDSQFVAVADDDNS